MVRRHAPNNQHHTNDDGGDRGNDSRLRQSGCILFVWRMGILSAHTHMLLRNKDEKIHKMRQAPCGN